jgi:dTDP-4-amino-4,6-dideoxygalactose transaminase
MSSGRAAMAMIFSILKENNNQSQRDEIVLPSYTCYSVPAAIEIAGLRVRICDIDPVTLSYDLQQFETIDFSRVLCVVSANLYGNPDDLKAIRAITDKAGCYFLDDAAQAMESSIDQRYTGTWGDIGLYSLDKGKNITSLQGGIIVTDNSEIADWITQKLNVLPPASIKQHFMDGVKLIIYTLLLKPWLYWIPAYMPGLGLGKTIYTTDYLFTQYSRSMAAISWRLFKRIDEITDQRISHAKALIDKLKDIAEIKFIEKANNSSSPVYLRLPILIENTDDRNRLIEHLVKSGIGASHSYPHSIADLDNISNFSTIHNNQAHVGRYVADHILTLPTLSYLNDSDFEKIECIIRDHL